jgi:hypothetical protein
MATSRSNQVAMDEFELAVAQALPPDATLLSRPDTWSALPAARFLLAGFCFVVSPGCGVTHHEQAPVAVNRRAAEVAAEVHLARTAHEAHRLACLARTAAVTACAAAAPLAARLTPSTALPPSRRPTRRARRALRRPYASV